MILKYGSTFTGAGGFELGIKRVFKKPKCEFYSEYDKFADQTYLKNNPEHKGLNTGDIERAVFDVVGSGKKKKLVINKLRVKKIFSGIKLLVGGPPCQDLSIAKSDRKGLDGEKSKLFFAFLAIKDIVKPDYFLMENVATMSNENKDKISEYLGVQPVKICVDRFTPQKRYRLYWFNWDLDLSLLPETGWRWPALVAWSSSNDYEDGKHIGKRERSTRDGRANTLTTGKGCGSYSSKNFIEYIDDSGELVKRIPTAKECEILQGLPIDFTAGVSDNQRYKQIGNAVNPDTIAAILQQCPINDDYKINTNQYELEDAINEVSK